MLTQCAASLGIDATQFPTAPIFNPPAQQQQQDNDQTRTFQRSYQTLCLYLYIEDNAQFKCGERFVMNLYDLYMFLIFFILYLRLHLGLHLGCMLRNFFYFMHVLFVQFVYS